MLTLGIENLGDVAFVACRGRIVQSDAAFKLRAAVMSQRNSRIVVLDLTEVQAIEGGGLGMLWFLQLWTQDHGIQLKLFNPTDSVKNRLQYTNAALRFNIATLEEMMFLVVHAENEYARAA